jgi:hypothetical protein
MSVRDKKSDCSSGYYYFYVIHCDMLLYKLNGLRRDLSPKFDCHGPSSSIVDESFTGISVYNFAVSRKKDLFLVLQPAVGEEGGGGEDEEGGEDDKPEESL